MTTEPGNLQSLPMPAALKGLGKYGIRFLGSNPIEALLKDVWGYLDSLLQCPCRKHEHKYFYSTDLFRNYMSLFILSA